MKISAALLSIVLAVAVFAASPVSANQAATDKKDAAKKENKWQGKVVRVNKDTSTIDIHGGAAPSETQRTISYDASTQWTNGGKPGQQEDVKAGSYIIVLGTVDSDGVLHAARIDLRAPR
jgi:Ni/Co efflux regulator RcnB